MAISVLAKWGNSLALGVPKNASGNFKEGDHFQVISDKTGLHLDKTRQIKKYSIPDVLETLPTEDNREMDWGSAYGKEIW